ncbi:MAG: 3-phosphoglycerate dehydrogenase family protein [Oscillospiraceae bacterium]|nr:3-phosphoglycerate dehydrogenase family protein [Oscillospiraceae bacterium]
MYRIKTLNKISPFGIEVVEENGISIDDATETPDAIMVRSANMNEMQFNENLLCIARAGAGTNNIPVSRCAEQGIVVFNTPGANAEAVKELVICALLMASRDVVGGIEWVHSNADKGDEIPAMVEKGKASFTGPEIAGKTLGVVGLGAIGAKIANTALELGMKVYGYDPFLSVDAAWRLSSHVMHATDIDTIYRNCDYITLHLPYIKNSTHHMINKEAFEKMKPGVRIINLARGELVCDEDLLDAIDSTKVARYVTDFPNAITSKAPNTLPIPHLGASTPESEEKCAIMAAQEAVDYLLNGNIKNSVNFPNVSLDRMGASRVCIIHRNVPRMLNNFLDLIGGANINVAHMINAPKGEFAYTIIDTDSPVGEEIPEAIAKSKDVFRVRIL